LPGSLNDILPDPISEADEEILLDLLHRKMGVLAGIAVDLLHAVEERFGPEVRKVVRDMAKGQEFPQRENAGDPEKDLHEFCTMTEKAAAGHTGGSESSMSPTAWVTASPGACTPRSSATLGNPSWAWSCAQGTSPG